jgi:hypothetical protein
VLSVAASVKVLGLDFVNDPIYSLRQLELIPCSTGKDVNMGVAVTVFWKVRKPNTESVHWRGLHDGFLNRPYDLPHDLLFFHVEFEESIDMAPRNNQGVAWSERVRVRDSHCDFGGHQHLIGRG